MQVDATTEESNGRVRRRSRGKTAAPELQRLRVVVARLQLQLKSLQRRKSWAHVSSEMEEMWRIVATSQANQRASAENSNVELRRSLLEQKQEAQRLMTLVLDHVRILQHELTSSLTSPIAPRAAVAEFLEQRIIAIYAQSLLQSTQNSERVGALNQEQNVESTVFGGMQVHLREEHMLPFQLSTVAQQCWELTLVDSLQKRCHLFEEVQVTTTDIKSPLWIRVSRPYGGFEAHGGVVLRRMIDHKGEVVILLSSIAFACGSDPSNLLDGFVILEEAWCRLRTLSKHTQRPRVHFEAAGSYEIRPLDKILPSNQSRLHTLALFLQRQLEEDSHDQAQRLENRLLQAAAAEISASRAVDITFQASSSSSWIDSSKSNDSSK